MEEGEEKGGEERIGGREGTEGERGRERERRGQEGEKREREREGWVGRGRKCCLPISIHSAVN